MNDAEVEIHEKAIEKIDQAWAEYKNTERDAMEEYNSRKRDIMAWRDREIAKLKEKPAPVPVAGGGDGGE